MGKTPQIEVMKKIENAALKIFASRGYDGTSVIGISKLSGISIFQIYRLYPNKYSLYNRMITDDFIEAFKRILEEKKYSARLMNNIYQLELDDNQYQAMLIIYKKKHNEMIRDILSVRQEKADVISQIKHINIYHTNGIETFVNSI